MFPENTHTCDISDAHPDLDVCTIQFIQYGGKKRFEGRVRTLKCLNDTALLMKIVEEPGNGAVLVIDGEGSRDCALLGDRHAATAMKNGWSGFIIFGAVRDTAGLSELDLGIKAVGSVPRRSRKEGTGNIDAVLRFGTAEFIPGGYVWSDSDGIVVAPPQWDSDSLEPVSQGVVFNH